MRLYPEESSPRAWRRVDLDALIGELRQVATRPVVLIDGRGGAGKSTLAEQLAAGWPAAAIVHTDDLAWHEPLFGWGHLLEELLHDIRTESDVNFRPPAWESRGRPGSIHVPADAPAVLVEGTGAMSPLADARIWVQSDRTEARRRGLARDNESGVNGTPAETAAFWDDWEAHEREFLARHRPWQRADFTVLGTAQAPLGQVLLAED